MQTMPWPAVSFSLLRWQKIRRERVARHSASSVGALQGSASMTSGPASFCACCCCLLLAFSTPELVPSLFHPLSLLAFLFAHPRPSPLAARDAHQASSCPLPNACRLGSPILCEAFFSLFPCAPSAFPPFAPHACATFGSSTQFSSSRLPAPRTTRYRASISEFPPPIVSIVSMNKLAPRGSSGREGRALVSTTLSRC